jgi:hypothetical protein
MMHVMDDAVIDPEKSAALDLIGRMEGRRYTRTRETFEPEGAALWAAKDPMPDAACQFAPNVY